MLRFEGDNALRNAKAYLRDKLNMKLYPGSSHIYIAENGETAVLWAYFVGTPEEYAVVEPSNVWEEELPWE